MRSLMPICLIFLSLQACAHHRDVRPGVDGLNSVSFKTERKSEGYQEAMSQAEHYCEKFKKRPVHLGENSQYVGTMKEDTYNTVKTVSQVAQAGGMATAVFGGTKERQIGAAAGIGGGIADSAIGGGYEYSLKFKCVD